MQGSPVDASLTVRKRYIPVGVRPFRGRLRYVARLGVYPEPAVCQRTCHSTPVAKRQTQHGPSSSLIRNREQSPSSVKPLHERSVLLHSVVVFAPTGELIASSVTMLTEVWKWESDPMARLSTTS